MYRLKQTEVERRRRRPDGRALKWERRRVDDADMDAEAKRWGLTKSLMLGSHGECAEDEKVGVGAIVCRIIGSKPAETLGAEKWRHFVDFDSTRYSPDLHLASASFPTIIPLVQTYQGFDSYPSIK